MSYESIQNAIDDAFQHMMEEECIDPITKEQAARWPLDNRARPFRMHTDGQVLCVPVQYVRSLDYYGGFEYVDADHRMQVGNWVIFSNESPRVAEVIDVMLTHIEDEEE